ncbi:MAG: CDP-diacylglycerol--glycerol-3-phosphate 3-phosphatidyltransferase [Erysipelotrichaceae bacterium]|nr:CDP-diacylglycerol--glycerol-3-phosphate 3-phosphatidyltransferase [Erysipelotrichaceae bacterium]
MKFKNMNLPNKLTTMRMILVPVMIVLFVLHLIYLETSFCDVAIYNDLTVLNIVMTVVFLLASITDYLDGHIARKRKIVSDYGKMMDPLADKLLVNTTMMAMMVCNMYQRGFIWMSVIAISLSIITIARDIFIDALRMQSLKKNVVVPANIYGKIKTATLMPGIVFLLLGGTHYIIYLIGLILVTIGGIFAIISGIKYFMNLKQYIGD